VRTSLSVRCLFGAVMALVLSVSYSHAVAAEFSADMVVADGDSTITNKIYVKGLKYRMEVMQDGQEIIVVVDQEKNLTRVALVSEKAYIEMPCDDMRSLMNDPFQSLKVTIATPGIEYDSLGTEKVNGIECDKVTLLWGDTEFYTYYMSRKYDFPVKIIRGDSEMAAELKNIKESDIDDGMFELPEGFSAMEEPQPAAETVPEETTPDFPEWVSNVTTAKFVTPPFERVMSSGDMIRIKVENGRNIWIMATNNHGGESTFLAVPFLKGRPIDDPSVVFAEYGETRMYEMMMEGQGWPVTLDETPGEADEVVVRVEQGDVKIEAEYTTK